MQSFIFNSNKVGSSRRKCFFEHTPCHDFAEDLSVSPLSSYPTGTTQYPKSGLHLAAPPTQTQTHTAQMLINLLLWILTLAWTLILYPQHKHLQTVRGIETYRSRITDGLVKGFYQIRQFITHRKWSLMLVCGNIKEHDHFILWLLRLVLNNLRNQDSPLTTILTINQCLVHYLI